jgi:peptide deformylase
MALRDIRIEGDEVLRKKSKRVDKIDQKILLYIQDLSDTLRNNGNGAGLAAPQIGILRRIIIVNTPEGYVHLINPELVEQSETHQVAEGCLSIPDVWGYLMRPKRVKVKALNEKGEEFFIVAEDDLAKCLCHEIDHLDGILFTDKVTKYIED